MKPDRAGGPAGRRGGEEVSHDADRATAVFGCGVDLVELPRFAKAVKRGGATFLNRIFTEQEQRYARQHRNPLPHLAARFAAKEAVVKAVAQAASIQLDSMKQIEISNDASGRPSVSIRGRLRMPLMLQVSLSHTEHLAMACAMAWPKNRRRPA